MPSGRLSTIPVPRDPPGTRLDRSRRQRASPDSASRARPGGAFVTLLVVAARGSGAVVRPRRHRRLVRRRPGRRHPRAPLLRRRDRDSATGPGDYSSAKEDIQRALQNRMRGEPAPPATTDPTPGDEGENGSSGGGTGGGGDGGLGTPGTETAPTRRPGPPTATRPVPRWSARPTPTARQLRPDSALILAGLALPRRPCRLRGLRDPPPAGAPAATPRGLAGKCPATPVRYTASTIKCPANKRNFLHPTTRPTSPDPWTS